MRSENVVNRPAINEQNFPLEIKNQIFTVISKK